MSATTRRQQSSDRASKELEESLKSIYGDEDNLDLTTIERRGSSRLTSFLFRLVGFLFLLTLVSWGGFWWWQTSGVSGPSQPLEISIDAPDTVISGTSSCFTVRYENKGQVPIAALSMTLNLPKTFEINETKPAADENSNWVMSPLGPSSDGSVNVCGVFRSEVPSTEKLQASFTYRPANFSSDFQDLTGAVVNIESSVITLETSGPEEAVVGNTITYSAKVKNTDLNKIENLRLRVTLPDSFTFKSSEPETSEVGLLFWDIASLEPGAERSVEFSGSFTSSASGLIPIVVEVGFLNADQNFVKQTESLVETNVLGGELSFQLIINGSGQDQTADLDSRLRGSLSFSNQGVETLENLSFALNLNSFEKDLPFDFEISDLAGGVKTGNVIVWDSEEVEDLANLAPEAKGVIDFSLAIPNKLESQMSDVVSLQIEATIEKISGNTNNQTIVSGPITINFNSDATISSEARYYDDEGVPVGSGPLPPQVGETTIYRIFWRLQNSLHDLKNASISTTLPTNVSWTDNLQASSGSLTFNNTTKQITWSLNEFTEDSAVVWFDLAITPKESDVGNFFKLINSTTFEATDVSTKDLVHGSTDALTTALPNDELAEGKGVVE